MGFIKQFKQFAIKGNVVDLAVAVIIGAAFSKIISSFVADVVTPLILQPALDAAGLKDIEKLTIFGTVKYGSFLSAVIGFLIVALILFAVVSVIDRSQKEEEAKPTQPPAPTKEELLLIEIRDILKSK